MSDVRFIHGPVLREGVGEELLRAVEEGLAQWVLDDGCQRFDYTFQTLGILGEPSAYRVSSGGVKESIFSPHLVVKYMVRLRKALADAERGAWTWCHLWMDASDLELHAEFDWMREPLFDQGRRPPSDDSCAKELEWHPRSVEYIPGWMAAGLARHRRVPAAVDVDVLELFERLFPDPEDVDGDRLFVWPDTRQGVEERMGRVLEAWLPGTGAQRVDIVSDVVDTYEVTDTRLRMRDGASVVVTLTEPEAWFWAEKARRAMVDPVRGAWTHAHLWMDVDELVLHSEYDWNTRPPFLDSVSETARSSWLANELRRFPRTPENTPTWLTNDATID
ncbi:hypothetical protein [Actinomyces respiraculi]|uniref:hypothetical protein n=1 Tax=Actinomyces respiraculi TaxID=2744574 RepID=UPI001420F471|nr:hypothetical protein [Actinomyces respiraculi]